MVRKTEIDKVIELAISFLYVDIAETDIHFVANHPFTNGWFVYDNDNKTFLDLHREVDLSKWREHMIKQIKNSDLVHIFMLLNRPYILNFLKFAQKYISDVDLGRILSNVWTSIEQISLDKSVTMKEIVRYFSRAAKDSLMNKDELEIYNHLPNEVTVYRGVTSYNKGCKKALSWTMDKKIAEWFANRFQTGTGEVWTLIVPKERILCFFAGRNEHEVIVDLYEFYGTINKEYL